MRDDARDISEKLGMTDEFTALNHLFSSFPGTGNDQSLLTGTVRAMAAKMPFDEDRVALFTKLSGALNADVLPRVAEPTLSADGRSAHPREKRGKTALSCRERGYLRSLPCHFYPLLMSDYTHSPE